MKTTKEIVNDNLRLVGNDNKKWYSEEELKEIINSCKRIIFGIQTQRSFEQNSWHNNALKVLEKELFGDE
jgi:hypothetical protein